MDDSTFRGLLRRAEGDALDFKARPYDLGTEKGKSELVKDVLAMANSW